MKYGLLQKSVWFLFHNDYKKQLIKYTNEPDINSVMKKAHNEYKKIIQDIPEFGENDTLLVNLVSGAQFAAIYKSLSIKPDIDIMTKIYHGTMDNNFITSKFAKKKLQAPFDKSNKEENENQALKSQKGTNPYTWKWTYKLSPDGKSYSKVFSECGINKLFYKLGIQEITPAMCSYDYKMAEAAGTKFKRKYTLAGGGPFCDCNYKLDMF